MKNTSLFQHTSKQTGKQPRKLPTFLQYSKLKYILPITICTCIIGYNKEYIEWEWNQYKSEQRKREVFLANNAYYQKYQTRPPGYKDSMKELHENREPVGLISRTLFRIKLWIMKHESTLDPILNPLGDVENREKAYETLKKTRQ